ncbi:MAG: hypothetical protein DHS80DRAFT_21057 [Piptocephalis tieghemiana]|nr:MAG: hypothetical protein DHS80DRAFT_21057 [Piptocephalis tieghemiana]
MGSSQSSPFSTAKSEGLNEPRDPMADFTPGFTDPVFETEENSMGDILDYITRRPVLSTLPSPPKRILLLSAHGLSTVPYLTRLFPRARITCFTFFPAAIIPNLSSNCELVSLDLVTSPLPFPSDFYDLIILRQINRALPSTRWPALLAETYRVCAPCGRVEILGKSPGGGKVGPHGQAVLEMFDQFHQFGQENYRAIDDLDVIIRQVGFSSPHHLTYQCPIGSWGGPGGEVLARLVRANNSMVVRALRRYAILHPTTAASAMADELEIKSELWTEEISCTESYVMVHAHLAMKPLA